VDGGPGGPKLVGDPAFVTEGKLVRDGRSQGLESGERRQKGFGPAVEIARVAMQDPNRA